MRDVETITKDGTAENIICLFFNAFMTAIRIISANKVIKSI